jgi:hypothetical protein
LETPSSKLQFGVAVSLPVEQTMVSESAPVMPWAFSTTRGYQRANWHPPGFQFIFQLLNDIF